MRKVLILISVLLVFGLGYYTHFAISENAYKDKLKPYVKQQEEDRSVMEAQQQRLGDLEKEVNELEKENENVSNRESLPDGINDLVINYVRDQFNYTSTIMRNENLQPYITAEMVSYFNKSEGVSANQSLRLESKLQKYEIGKYYLEDATCKMTVRVWTSFQIEKNPKMVNQMLLDLELVKNDDVWLVNKQEVGIIN